MSERSGDDLVEDAVRRLRRHVCVFIAIAGLFFAVFVIQTQPTAVGIVGGSSAALASVLAASALVAKRRQHAVERAWLAAGLATLSVTLIILLNVL